MKPLDERERRILDHYLKGNSRRKTAADLGFTESQVIAALKRCKAKGYNIRHPQGSMVETVQKAARDMVTLRQPVRVRGRGLGRVAEITPYYIAVQLGPDGPLRKYKPGSLTFLTEEQVKGTRLEGTS